MADAFTGLDQGWVLLAGFALAYLLGSVPFGLILTRWAGLGDIRSVGSGNIGATNVLRAGGKGLAAATLLLDAGKGAAAVLIGRHFGPELAAIAAVGAVIGHIAPVWLGFRGGKGMATAIGALLALAWPAGLLVCATWLAVAFLSRYSSLATMIAVALAPLYTWALAGPLRAAAAAVIAVLVLVRHRDNIRRLLSGTESRIGEKG